MGASVVSLNVSAVKGVKKGAVHKVHIRKGFGIEGDVHASESSHRQVSLLAVESIEKMRKMGLDVHPGDFAENITTSGINLPALTIGTRIAIGDEVELQVSQIGKICHSRCAIYEQAGDCIMPREGIFVTVLRGGHVRRGDRVWVAPEAT